MQFRILGPVDVTDDDQPLGITARRERAVLLRLLMEPGRPIGPERLIDDVWGDDPPADGRGSLRVLVARLRRRLTDHDAEPRILTGSAGYELRLSMDDEVDAARFEAVVGRARDALADGDPATGADSLRAALALWRGPALGDLADLDFARPEAVRLEEARLAALEARIEADLLCGRHASLAGELEGLCQTHPLREGLWAHRMVALYRSGRQTEALRVFQDLRRVLAEEVGLEPTPALVRLEATLVAGELPDPPATTGQGARAAVRTTLPNAPTPFVGRVDELEILAAHWEAACSGARRVVLLHGEPGAGKTRLAEEVAARVEAGGWTALSGHFDEEMLLPYQAFVEAMRDVPSAPADAGAPNGDGIVEQLFGALSVAPGGTLQSHGAGELERYRLFAAVEAALEDAAARAPVLLVLDDLHWADAPSLLLLKQVARSRTPAGLLVLATYRDTELHEDHPLTGVLGQLHRAKNVDDLDVGSLELADVTVLVESRLGLDEDEAEAVAAAVVHRTDGHALFTEALVDAMADPGRDPLSRQALDVPTTVREFVASSFGRLSRPGRAMLALGATCGTTFPLASALAASGLAADAGIDGIVECTRMRLLQEGGDAGRVRFAHNLVRDVVYANLPQVRRSQLHQALADALEADVPGDPARSAEIARHLALAPSGAANLRRRVDHARRAGEASMRVVAFESAASHFLDALDAHRALAGDALERAALLLLAAKPLVLTGQPGQATSLCEEAIALARNAGDAGLVARAALVLEEASWTGYGFMAPATAAASEAVLRDATEALVAHDGVDAGAGQVDEHAALRTELMARLPRVLHFGTSPAQRLPIAEESLRRAEISGSPRLRGAALEGMRWALWGGRDVQRLAEVSERILDEAVAAGDGALEVRAQVWRYLSRLDLGDLVGARAAVAALRAMGEELPEPLALWYPEMADTTLALLAGRVGDAEAAALRAFGVARRLDLAWAIESFGIQLQQVRREQGRLGELEEATTAVAATHAGEPVWQLARVDLEVELGRRGNAAAQLREIVPQVVDLPHDLTWLAAVALAADLAADLEDETAAALLYPLLLPHADQVVVVGPGVVCMGSAARQAGALAGLLGLWESAEVHFDSALARNEALDAAPWLARTHLARASVLTRQGQTAPAAACLAEARSLAVRLGATQVLASCDRLNDSQSS